jgi:hypothetical protein
LCERAWRYALRDARDCRGVSVAKAGDAAWDGDEADER